jgi:hypothetical protein
VGGRRTDRDGWLCGDPNHVEKYSKNVEEAGFAAVLRRKLVKEAVDGCKDAHNRESAVIAPSSFRTE